MKKTYTIITGLSLLFFYATAIGNGTTATSAVGQPKTPAENTLTIMGAPELFDLATNWANEYARLNPETAVAVNVYTATEPINNNALYFVTEGYSETNGSDNQWTMPVGREAVVLVMNAQNPMLEEINRQGISPEKLIQAFSSPENRNWESVIGNGKNAAVNFYSANNTTVKKKVAAFLKANPSEILEMTADEFVTSVKKDLYAIGFCKLSDVLDAGSNEITANVKLLPLDKNNNGRMETFERIYDDVGAFTRGVWLGKYPKALCGNVFVVSQSKPEDTQALAFLSWILADGQQLLNPHGFSGLTSAVKRSSLEVLAGNTGSSVQSGEPNVAYSWPVVFLGLFGFGMVVLLVFRILKKGKSSLNEESLTMVSGLDEDSVLAPKGLYFDKTHTWAFMEKDGQVKIGVDDFLQHITGTLTRVKMRDDGETIRKGEKILTIVRNGKQLNIYSPVSGVIKEHNERLMADSSLINSSPYADGWVYLIEPKNWLREIQFLFPVENYKEWLEDEFTRLKDFFSVSMRSNTAVYEHIVLQDGGEITDNVLADLGPEVWEDFQNAFIDTSK
jgi:glycine cleavage system H lipoate-binding protein/ABC-type phosphate transport system substrate-binding protein